MTRSLLTVTILAVLVSSAFGEISRLAFADGKVTFTSSVPDTVVVGVYDRDNRSRATVFGGAVAAGQQSAAWNGCGYDGKPLPAGDYALVARVGRTSAREMRFGAKGVVQLLSPTSICTDAKGALYVVDIIHKGRDVASGESALHKFNPDGSPCVELFKWWGARPTDPRVDSIKLPRFTVWLEVTDDNCFLYNHGNVIAMTQYSGKAIRTIGAYEWKIDDRGEFSPRPGSAWPVFGIGIGAGNALYIRDRNAIRVYDRTKTGFDGYLYSSAEGLPNPPVEGVNVGPCIASDRFGRIYSTSVKGLSRYTDTGKSIEWNYDATTPFRECMSVALGADGMIYVADRGVNMESKPDPALRGKIRPVPRVHQFWDSGEKLNLVCSIDVSPAEGLRDAAVSPEGDAVYVVEDADNFAVGRAGEPWPQRSLEGKARLLKFKLASRQEARATLTIR